MASGSPAIKLPTDLTVPPAKVLPLAAATVNSPVFTSKFPVVREIFHVKTEKVEKS